MGQPYIKSATTLLHCNLLYSKNETSDVNMKQELLMCFTCFLIALKAKNPSMKCRITK